MTQGDDRATILVIDDERGPRESLRMILSPQHDVLLARHGAEALDLLGEHAVDLVTLDLNMPGLGGQELMRRLREEHSQVEIIVITGCGTIESATEGIRFGICDYLQKPFNADQLAGTLEKVFSPKRRS